MVLLIMLHTSICFFSTFVSDKPQYYFTGTNHILFFFNSVRLCEDLYHKFLPLIAKHVLSMPTNPTNDILCLTGMTKVHICSYHHMSCALMGQDNNVKQLKELQGTHCNLHLRLIIFWFVSLFPLLCDDIMLNSCNNLWKTSTNEIHVEPL